MPGTGKLILGTPKVVSLPERGARLAIWPLGVNTANASTRPTPPRPTPPSTNGGEVAAVGYSNNAQCWRIFVPYFAAHQMHTSGVQLGRQTALFRQGTTIRRSIRRPRAS